MFALRLVRLGALAAILAGLLKIQEVSPTIGFAVAMALIAFAITARMEYERLTVDRMFLWSGRPASKLVALPLSILSSLGLALVVGVAALFTFADPDAMQDLNAELAEQFKVDNPARLKVLIGTIVMGVLIALGFDRLSAGNGHRWAMYQLAGVFGILFSVGIQVMAADAKADAGNLGRESRIALQPFGDFAVLDLTLKITRGAKDCAKLNFSNPLHLTPWRTNKCGLKRDLPACRSKSESGVDWVNYGCAATAKEACDALSNSKKEPKSLAGSEAWIENACGLRLNETKCREFEERGNWAARPCLQTH